MKEFLFYTYDSAGRDVIITVRAADRAAAFKEFDRLHGEDTPIDFAIERGQEYPIDFTIERGQGYAEAICDAVQRGEIV